MTQQEADVLVTFGVDVDPAEINGVQDYPTPKPTPSDIIEMLEFFHVRLDQSDIDAIQRVHDYELEMPQPVDCATIHDMQSRHPGHRVFVESHDPTTAMITVPLFYLEALENIEAVRSLPDDTVESLRFF